MPERPVAVDPWSTFVWTCRATWHELAPVIGVSLAWLLSGLPLAVAVAAGEPWLAGLTVLPLLIGLTGLCGSLAGVSRGGGVRAPWRASFDPSLAGLAWLWLLTVAWVAGVGPAGVVAGSVLGALAVAVLPLAFAYGAVRERRGAAALRGGVIIAVLQPGLALTVGAGLCLAAFALVATAGTLLVVAPALVLLMACRAAALLVEATNEDPASD